MAVGVRTGDRAALATVTSVDLLGPLIVRAGPAEVPIAGGLLRSLLLRLVLEAPRPVSTASLIDAVWGGEPPEEPVNALQSLVSRLRRCLGGGPTVIGGPAGYRVSLPGLAVDADRFSALAAEGRRQLREADPRLAATTLRRALDLWRGEALADAGPADWARPARRTLEVRRIDALLDRADADAALGLHAALADELAALDLQHPLDERFAGRLVDALAADGRTAAALAAYEQFRARVADALGTDPSPRLRARHLALLRGADGPDREPFAGDAEAARESRSGAADAGPARRPGTGLPLAITTFVGRGADLEAVGRLLATGRLVSVVGTGGCGKTRLATEVARAAEHAVLGEVRLVHLAPVSAGSEVPAVVLSTLGVHESRLAERPAARLSTPDPTGRIVDAIGDRAVLLLLDNCEHLLTAVAELTERLLGACPGLRILTTSREPLALTGEALWPLSPLGVPPAPARSPGTGGFVPAPTPGPVPGPVLATLAGFDAVRLFCERAQAVQPSFVLDATTAPDVTEIVRRLDGLPLAIELAAARLRTLPLAQITAGLSDRFRLLTGGARTALPRHRTLKAVVEWSWDLLTDTERDVAEGASVFAAGLSAAGALAVCRGVGDAGSDLGAPDITDVLASLVDKSLLTLDRSGAPRYRMLETLREFGIERLASSGRLSAAHDAHAAYFAGLAARAEPELRTAGQLPWIRELVAERENLSSAIRRLASERRAAAAVTMVTRLSWFWIIADWHADFHQALSVAIEAADEQGLEDERRAGDAPGAGRPRPDPVELLCLRGLLIVSSAALGVRGTAEDEDGVRDRLGAVAEEFDRIVTDPQKIPDARRALFSLVRAVLGGFATDPDRRSRAFGAILADPMPWLSATGHVLVAAFAENDGDVPTLREHARLGVAALRPLGERWALFGALRLAAQVDVYDGDLPAAAAAYAEALRYSSELSAEFGTAGDDVFVRLQLARVLQRLGDVDGALAQARLATAQPAAALPDLRGIATDALLLQVLEAAGQVDEVAGVRARIAAKLADRPPRSGPFGGHETALALSIGASIDLEGGRVDQAAAALSGALDAAVHTRDQPVIAAVGLTIARLAEARGEPVTAALAVGACSSIRGAADETDPDLIRLLDRLRADLGPGELARLTDSTGDRSAALDVLRSALGGTSGPGPDVPPSA